MGDGKHLIRKYEIFRTIVCKNIPTLTICLLMKTVVSLYSHFLHDFGKSFPISRMISGWHSPFYAPFVHGVLPTSRRIWGVFSISTPLLGMEISPFLVGVGGHVAHLLNHLRKTVPISCMILASFVMMFSPFLA